MKKTLLATCLFLTVSAPAFAQDAKTALLQRVEHYLEQITTVQSDFVQVAPDGSLATGKFYLRRPGKMRWQYDPPVPVLMVSNGKMLTYYDYELEQVSEIPLDDTLAGFIAQPDIKFDTKVFGILEAREENNVIRVRINQKDSPEDGELTLELSDNPVELRNLVIKDKEGKETNVSLSNAAFGVPLKDSLFQFRNPRFFDKRKR